MAEEPKGAFEKAGEEFGDSLLREFWHLLRETKKWWLLPILVILLAVAGLLLLSATTFAPFIYTLF